jgi:hypothetical protein
MNAPGKKAGTASRFTASASSLVLIDPVDPAVDNIDKFS